MCFFDDNIIMLEIPECDLKKGLDSVKMIKLLFF